MSNSRHVFRLKFVIRETSSDSLDFIVEYIEDGRYFTMKLSDVTEYIDRITGVSLNSVGEVIIDSDIEINTVNNKQNTGGVLVRGLNDLDTYCRLNGKLAWLSAYNNADNELDAHSITRSSNKMVNVKCPTCGYEKRVLLSAFITTQKNACEVCAGKLGPKVVVGVNDLESYCKNNNLDYLIDEYFDERPMSSIAKSSHDKVTWKCSYGHVWNASPDHRSRGEGCPKCTGAQTSRTERIICEWLKENNVNIVERHKIEGLEFDIDIVDYNILIEFNSDATHISEYSRERDAQKREVAKSLNKKFIVVMQQCYPELDNTLDYDIVFKADRKDYIDKLREELIKEFKKHGLNIDKPVSKEAIAMANKNKVPFERSLVGVYPDIIGIWGGSNEVTPDLVFAKSRRFIYLVCKEHGEEYSVRTDSLAYTYNNNKGCPYCSGAKVKVGVNDLLTLEPDLCKDWNEPDLSPSEVSRFSNLKVNWKCQWCGHEWNAMINSRTGVNRTRCPECLYDVPIPHGTKYIRNRITYISGEENKNIDYDLEV